MPARWKAMIVAAALAFVAAAAVQISGQAEALVQKAIQAETVDGDLKAAIALYEKAVAAAGSNRSVAAKALVQMGECYEKMGDAGARKAYERVVQDYADQPEQLKLARTRLVALAKGQEAETAKPIFTRIQLTNKLYNEAALSPDGQTLAFAAQGSVWTVPVHGKVRPDLTGVPVKLTEPMGAGGALTWSADGRRIAFNAQNGMFVIPSAGGETKELPLERLHAGQPGDARLSLSPDGKSIAYTSFERLRSPGSPSPPFVYLAPTDGGEARRFLAEPATEPAFSPDGSKLAYLAVKFTESESESRKQTTRLTEVWTRPVGDGKPALVSDLPGWAVSPTWSPDGQFLAFLQSEPGYPSRALYVAHLDSRGSPTAPPTKIGLPFESYDVLPGWSSDNRIGILAFNPTREAIYTVPATGGRAAQVSPTGNAAHPRWSPDGKRIYLRWDGGQIAYVPAEGGEVTAFPKKVTEDVPGGGNDVSPDGTKIVFAGYYYNPEMTLDIFTVPISGGDPVPLRLPPSAQARFPCWSPDGKTIAFVGTERVGDRDIRIYIATVPASGGEMKRITSETDDVLWSTVAWSPSGGEIAYFAADRTLRVIPAAGGPSRVAARLSEDPKESLLGLGALGQFEMAWSPDGAEIAYAQPNGLWAVASTGGEPRSIGTGLSDIRAVTKIDWSPDGKTIAFTGVTGEDRELWLMEDFLSLVKGGK